MATRSPVFTPSDFKTFAHFETSESNCRYVRVRISPGSPSQIIAALFLRQVEMWRSRQLCARFIFPSTNHFAHGTFQSSTFVHGSNQSSSRAIFPQKISGS